MTLVLALGDFEAHRVIMLDRLRDLAERFFIAWLLFRVHLITTNLKKTRVFGSLLGIENC